MKLSFSFLLLAWASLVSAVLGDRAIRTILNNGNVLPSGETCNSTEWDSIKSAMSSARRRNLRTADRRLDPYWCASFCSGFAPGYCWLVYPACYYTRRREAEVTELELSAISGGGKLRELQSTACDDRISTINDSLDALDSLSSGCQTLVDAPRGFACFGIVECEITSFNLWNTYDGTVSVLTDGASFSKDSEINIEAVADDCTSRVNFEITGPNGYGEDKTDHNTPWVMFGNINGNTPISGLTLDAGSYNLTAFPDDNMGKSQTISFTVMD